MVTGGGSDTPDGVVGTALYQNTDPGVSETLFACKTYTDLHEDSIQHLPDFHFHNGLYSSRTTTL